jgi:hypothetical protein
MARAIIQLRITLDGVEPTVWRRVLIPGGFTLDRVHRVVQFAMGWGDRHLHVFDIDGVQYGVPDPDGLLDVRDELDTRLDAGHRGRYDGPDGQELGGDGHSPGLTVDGPRHDGERHGATVATGLALDRA